MSPIWVAQKNPQNIFPYAKIAENAGDISVYINVPLDLFLVDASRGTSGQTDRCAGRSESRFVYAIFFFSSSSLCEVHILRCFRESC